MGKPKPRAFADVFGGEKRLEGLGHDCRAHAAARVTDRQHDIPARLGFFGALRQARDPLVTGLQGQRAATDHGIAGIDRQVENDHFGLGRIDQGIPQVICRFSLHPDTATQRALQQLEHPLKRIVEIDRHGLEALPT